MKKLLLVCFTAIIIFSCKTTQVQQIKGTDNAIAHYGRSFLNKNQVIELVGSAARIEFQFAGDSCLVSLNNIAGTGDYNYIALELDGVYQGRMKIANTSPKDYVIKTSKSLDWHSLRIYKATEAANGVVGFYGVKAKAVKALPNTTKLTIEFIGNSITCGMGNDTKEIPCGNGSKWYDQHNAYWSYASRVGRGLNANFMLSAISGAGIYRNWNSDGPTVPQQYESAYLRTDSTLRWNFNDFTPDIVSIALGTNDLSSGDGKTPRAAFSSEAFTNTYVTFIQKIVSYYPNAQIVLLTSPMVKGERAKVLMTCLKNVQSIVAKKKITTKAIKLFEFSDVEPTGCGYHPSIEEHEVMANQLLPFMQDVAKGLK